MKILSKADGIKKVKSMQKTGGARIYKVKKVKTNVRGKNITMYNLYTKNTRHSSMSNPYGLEMMRDGDKAAYLIPVNEAKCEDMANLQQRNLANSYIAKFDKDIKGIIKYLGNAGNRKKAMDLMKIYKKYWVEFVIQWQKTQKLNEEKKRDYKAEYKKFQSSPKMKKYRAELNKYNRKKGTYGNGDGKDASHKGGKIVGFEAQSKNRGRAEKSRLKKESVCGCGGSCCE